jgi:hypothetical protein
MSTIQQRAYIGLKVGNTHSLCAHCAQFFFTSPARIHTYVNMNMAQVTDSQPHAVCAVEDVVDENFGAPMLEC